MRVADTAVLPSRFAALFFQLAEDIDNEVASRVIALPGTIACVGRSKAVGAESVAFVHI